MGNAVAVLDKNTETLSVGKTTLRGVVPWGSRIPIHEAFGKLREIRKENPKANFPSNTTMDDLLVFRWDNISEAAKDFLRTYTPVPLKEWVAYGAKGAKLSGATIQYQAEGWTAVVDGIPKESVERYNEAIGKGLNAALVIRAYNEDSLPVVESGNKRAIVTPSKKGIIVVKGFVRDNGTEGKVDSKTRLAVSGKAVSEQTRRWSYTVDNKLSYVGPLVRGIDYGVVYGDRRFVGAYLEPPFRLGVLVADAGQSTVPNAKLQLAEKIARDAAPELQKLEGSGIIKPESIENLSELIKVLTGQ